MKTLFLASAVSLSALQHAQHSFKRHTDVQCVCLCVNLNKHNDHTYKHLQHNSTCLLSCQQLLEHMHVHEAVHSVLRKFTPRKRDHLTTLRSLYNSVGGGRRRFVHLLSQDEGVSG